MDQLLEGTLRSSAMDLLFEEQRTAQLRLFEQQQKALLLSDEVRSHNISISLKNTLGCDVELHNVTNNIINTIPKKIIFSFALIVIGASMIVKGDFDLRNFRQRMRRSPN